MEKQKSAEWFKKRIGHITGSVAGAILGLCPWRTSDDVLRTMVREYHGAPGEFTGNIATEYGNFNEPGAIIEYTMETGNPVEECGFFEDRTHPWLGASPDGLIGKDGLIEVKCPWSKRTTGDFLSINKQPWYFAQVQIELYCTMRDWCDFYQWSPVGTKTDRIFLQQSWINSALPELKEFYDVFLEELKNPIHLEPLRKKVSAKRLIDQYDEAQKIIDEQTEKKKGILEQLVELSGGKNAEIEGRKLTLVEKKGSISYSKAFKDLMPDVDLSKYQGKPSSYWRLS